MSTPIFDRLMAESDDTTRALVWQAVTREVFIPVSDKAQAAWDELAAAFTIGPAFNVTPCRTSAEVRADGLLGGAW